MHWEFQDAVERYELRRSSKPRQTQNYQQTTVITSKYVQGENEDRNSNYDLQVSRQTQRVLEKYQVNSQNSHNEVNRQSVKEARDKYRRGRGTTTTATTQLKITQVKYSVVSEPQQKQQKETIFEGKNSRYVEEQNYSQEQQVTLILFKPKIHVKQIMNKQKKIVKLVIFILIMFLAIYLKFNILLLKMNYQTTTIIQITACSLSLIGSIVIIVIYFKMGMSNNFALKLIMCLAISDIIFSLSNLMYYEIKFFLQQIIQYIYILFQYIHPGCNPTYQNLCITQGFFIQYSTIACYLFYFLLYFCVFWTVIKKRENLNKYQRHFLLIGFCVPILFAVIPVTTNSYNTQKYVCGISNEDGDSYCNELDNEKDTKANIARIESISLFYVPLWLLNIVGISIIIRISVFMAKLRTSTKQILYTPQEFEIVLSYRITQNMLLYPIIMLICYSGMTVYAIAKLCGSEIESLRGIRFIMADFLGLLNSIAYGYFTIILLRLQKMMSQQYAFAMISLQ